jgi:hypothetical protein
MFALRRRTEIDKIAFHSDAALAQCNVINNMREVLQSMHQCVVSFLVRESEVSDRTNYSQPSVLDRCRQNTMR